MTADVDALLRKADASIKAAELLENGGHQDFAASRAYYAMYYAAEALFASEGRSFSSHSALLSAFGREYAKGGRMDPKYHRMLLDAQDLRSTGDYETGESIGEDQVREILVWAKDFTAEARKILAGKK